MSKSKKIREILSAKELLRVASVHIRISKSIRFLFVIVISMVFLLAFIYVLMVFDREAPMPIRIYLLIGIAGLYGLSVAVLMRSTNRGNPLIITERGIVIIPAIVEVWEDLEKYGWETFTGTQRVSLTSKGEGTCLYIINKGNFQRNIESWTGHTSLSQYGIFFRPEQIIEAEKILRRFGLTEISSLKFNKDGRN